MAFLYRLSLIAPPSSPFPLLSGLDLVMFITVFSTPISHVQCPAVLPSFIITFPANFLFYVYS